MLLLLLYFVYVEECTSLIQSERKMHGPTYRRSIYTVQEKTLFEKLGLLKPEITENAHKVSKVQRMKFYICATVA
jgi:hypothetical protein